MTVSNWFGFALLIILCALTLCAFMYLGLYVRQLRRNQPPERNAPKPPTNSRTTTFAVSQVPDRLTLGLEDAPDLWAKLTKREKQVARLASSGLSDVEIGAELSITDRTVGNHLYKIYSKLEINSRRELKYLLRQIEDDSG